MLAALASSSGARARVGVPRNSHNSGSDRKPIACGPLPFVRLPALAWLWSWLDHCLENRYRRYSARACGLRGPPHRRQPQALIRHLQRCPLSFPPRTFCWPFTKSGRSLKSHLPGFLSAGGGSRTRTPHVGTPDFKSGAYRQFRHPGYARQYRPRRFLLGRALLEGEHDAAQERVQLLLLALGERGRDRAPPSRPGR